MLNEAIIMGRLTADPELRYTNSKKAVVSFNVAVDRDLKNKDGERGTDFIRCTFYGSTAEHICSYYKKGSMIVIIGRIQQSKWTDRDGNSRETLEILGHHCYFGDSKKSEAQKTTGFTPVDISEADGDFSF